MRFAGTPFAKSQFIRSALTPIVGVSALILPFLGSDWDPTKIAVYVGLEIVLVCFFLVLVSPRRFEWAGGVAAGIVFIAYIAYLVSELREDPSSLLRVGKRSETSAFNAVLGLFVWGVPGLLMALATFRSLRRRAKRIKRKRRTVPAP